MSFNGKKYPFLSEEFQKMSDEEIDARLPDEFKGMRRIFTHPGQILPRAMETLGITRVQLQDDLDLSEEELQSLLAGKMDVSAELAEKLEACIGASAEMFLNMQRSHDITKKVFDPKP